MNISRNGFLALLVSSLTSAYVTKQLPSFDELHRWLDASSTDAEASAQLERSITDLAVRLHQYPTQRPIESALVAGEFAWPIVAPMQGFELPTLDPELLETVSIAGVTVQPFAIEHDAGTTIRHAELIEDIVKSAGEVVGEYFEPEFLNLMKVPLVGRMIRLYDVMNSGCGFVADVCRDTGKTLHVLDPANGIDFMALRAITAYADVLPLTAINARFLSTLFPGSGVVPAVTALGGGAITAYKFGALRKFLTAEVERNFRRDVVAHNLIELCRSGHVDNERPLLLVYPRAHLVDIIERASDETSLAKRMAAWRVLFMNHPSLFASRRYPRAIHPSYPNWRSDQGKVVRLLEGRPRWSQFQPDEAVQFVVDHVEAAYRAKLPMGVTPLAGATLSGAANMFSVQVQRLDRMQALDAPSIASAVTATASRLASAALRQALDATKDTSFVALHDAAEDLLVAPDALQLLSPDEQRLVSVDDRVLDNARLIVLHAFESGYSDSSPQGLRRHLSSFATQLDNDPVDDHGVRRAADRAELVLSAHTLAAHTDALEQAWHEGFATLFASEQSNDGKSTRVQAHLHFLEKLLFDGEGLPETGAPNAMTKLMRAEQSALQLVGRVSVTPSNIHLSQPSPSSKAGDPGLR